MGKKKHPPPMSSAPAPQPPLRPEPLPLRPEQSPRDWSPMEKVRVVAAATQLKDDELGEFLRREGLHLAQVEEWRSEIVTSLGGSPPRAKNPDARRVRELEREVARKDKALAEVTALLVLEKKLQALFGSGSAGEGDSTDEDDEQK